MIISTIRVQVFPTDGKCHVVCLDIGNHLARKRHGSASWVPHEVCLLSFCRKSNFNCTTFSLRSHERGCTTLFAWRATKAPADQSATPFTQTEISFCRTDHLLQNGAFRYSIDAAPSGQPLKTSIRIDCFQQSGSKLTTRAQVPASNAVGCCAVGMKTVSFQ